MAQRLGTSAQEISSSAWLPAAVEAEAYEGLRRGEEAAFRVVAEALQPVLLRLARLAGGTDAETEIRVVRTWELTLRGLDMFRWQIPFASWVAGVTVDLGRSRTGHRRVEGRAVTQPPLPAPRTSAGPPDWADLPWGARWGGAWPVLGSAVMLLPLDQREVVQASDIERWPPRRGCDVLGLAEARYQRLLWAGRTQLRDALAPLVGAPTDARALDSQRAAVVAMLPALIEEHEQVLDPSTTAVFRHWARTRRRGRWSLRRSGRVG